jgi:hypothetical protein
MNSIAISQILCTLTAFLLFSHRFLLGFSRFDFTALGFTRSACRISRQNIVA